MTARYRSREKISVTLTLMPWLITSVIAASPSCVAGILMYRLSRFTVVHSRRAISAVAAGVTAQPRVDLDRHAPVQPGRLRVHRRQDVTARADIVGSHGEHRGVHVRAAGGQVSQLVVVAVAPGQG